MAYVQKALITKVLPVPVARILRQRWEDLRDWIDTFTFGLRFVCSRSLHPKVLLYFGYAPGDDLLCTAVLRELRKRGKDRLLMVSDHKGLFEGNPDPAYVRPLWARYSRDHSTVSICKRFVRIWGGQFTRLEYAPMKGKDRRLSPSRHVIAEMCARAGITGPVLVRPYLTLEQSERSRAAWASGHIVIQSSGAAARHPALNKEWYPERFQAVVNALRGELAFVQLGSVQDPPLQGVKDLRGATSMRQAAAILYHARLYVGLEGFLMHLARTVECPAVIIFGGRTAPQQLGYICNFNLSSNVACAPCWRSNTCDFDRECMSDISAHDVVSAIRQMLARPRNPLAAETAEVTTGAAVTLKSSGASF